ARDRARIIALHQDIANAAEAQDGKAVTAGLTALEAETQDLAQSVFAARAARNAGKAG
ncbi:MAG TPA: FadR family transcriptional regulator, partial [Sulfitobacter sp.]|nr:FadR family transcriptional regulator [Sulfitobacter sp.]